MARNDEPGIRNGNGRKPGSGKWSKYRASSGAGHSFDWSNVDSSVILDALVAVTESGAALLLGKTRDGGSGVVTVCDGDDRCKFYASDAEGMTRELEEVIRVARGE